MMNHYDVSDDDGDSGHARSLLKDLEAIRPSCIIGTYIDYRSTQRGPHGTLIICPLSYPRHHPLGRRVLGQG